MTRLSTVLTALILPFTVGFAEPAKSERDIQAELHRKMRFEYANSPSYNPYAGGLADIKKASNAYLEKGDFDAAIHEAEKGLRIDKLNIDLLMVAAAAYRQKGDLKKADQCRKEWMSLLIPS